MRPLRSAVLTVETAATPIRVRVSEATGGGLLVEVEAPYFGDPAPPTFPGPTDRLFEFEVVELFLAQESDPSRYLEVELSPHGHHFVLAFEGVRNAVAKAIQIPYAAQLDGERWRGVAFLSTEWVPEGELLANAFAAHGSGGGSGACSGAGRRFLSAWPFPGEQPGDRPNFHRPHAYPRLFPVS